MYIYKTTNLLNGKIYVGLSKFKPEENPEYLGSGYILKRAIKCYGEKSFIKEILEVCQTKEQTLERERYWIATLKANNREIGYNICEGGTWGDTWSNHPRKEELSKMVSERVKGKGNPNYGNKWTKEQKKKGSEFAIKNRVWIDKKTGIPWAQLPESRKKISETKMGLQNPRANLWKLVSPIGEEFFIEGGIKREIKKYGLDYQQFKAENGPAIRIDDKTTQNCKGWKLIKLDKPC